MTQATTILSRHAITRCQQRGVPWKLLSALLDLWDREIPARGGCTSVCVSRVKLTHLQGLGYPRSILEGLAGLTAILSPQGLVITVTHATR